MMLAEMKDLLSKEELEIVSTYSPGFARKPSWGKSPAVMAIDFTYSFVGLDAPITESIKKWPKSSGNVAWKAVRNTEMIIVAARIAKIPIFYTAAPKELRSGSGFGSKTQRETDDYGAITVVEEIAPQHGDTVIRKTYPSAFFGTNLLSELLKNRIDTLVVTGGTTSGCVRASVVDASSYHFHIIVVSDAVFDRIQVSGLVNLFDMRMKYADVATTAEVLDYLKLANHS